MYLRTLNLNFFRCFESLRLELQPGVTLFHGNNAQGKTSILEAACVLLRLQSPRTSTLAECIQFSQKAFAIGGDLKSNDPVELRFQYRETGRRLLVDGENQKSAGDFLRQSGLVVWMANDDLALVRAGGDGRRRFLDFMASQIFPGYRQALKAYEKALRSRNWLLKRDASPRWPEIDAYSQLLNDYGQVLTSSRRVLIEHLQPKAADSQRRISGSDETLTLTYESASGGNDDLISILAGRRDEEMRKRQTVAGPHRDDLRLDLNGMPAAKFASEGQQRTVALALKLGQTNLFFEARGEAPLMLIDDVFGELDPARRNALMANWPTSSQKLITTTHLDWLDERFDEASRFSVTGALVERG
ncbi:MAG: DNA replication and repair protein RecF [Verrucomicrobiales bacterium]|jgi:DNA replication and repair protein RecF|nr:DNA replication and repair protein RecF [Verrucomicrobiales bacterium]MBP9223405.1 DNA replication and repair protein RecF [Verrucomicrobiales bacterium]HQZ29871.1 DNA replication and repair protein RecF [Verrucomicrobiales bacterium]